MVPHILIGALIGAAIYKLTNEGKHNELSINPEIGPGGCGNDGGSEPRGHAERPGGRLTPHHETNSRGNPEIGGGDGRHHDIDSTDSGIAKTDNGELTDGSTGTTP